MKTTGSPKPNRGPSAGVLLKNKREAGATTPARSTVRAPRPSRTTVRPQRETTVDAIPAGPASRAAATLVPSSREDQATHQSISRSRTPAFPDLGGFSELRKYTRCYLDAVKYRCAIENRIKRGPNYLLAGPDGTPLLDVKAIMKSITADENTFEKAMLQAFRALAPEVAAWAEKTRGVGEHTVACLLGIIGHPAIAEPYERVTGAAPPGHVCGPFCGVKRGTKTKTHLVAKPRYYRSVAQLWAYCGLGDVSRKRRKGMDGAAAMADGNAEARVICQRMVQSQKWSGISRASAAYRPLYDEAKADFADRHPEASKLHCDNHALRRVAKEMVKHIWIVARRSLGLPVTKPEIQASEEKA